MVGLVWGCFLVTSGGLLLWVFLHSKELLLGYRIQPLKFLGDEEWATKSAPNWFGACC